MGRRSSNRMFREFLCSLAIGFLTGFITSHTVLAVMRRRHEETCRNTSGLGRYRASSSSSSSGGHGNQLPRDVNIPSERLMFLGVMTTRKYLKTRADAIYKTWGSRIPGRLVFFVGTGADYDTSLPVIVLSDVPDDVYPPQRKAFEMLKYMSGNHGNDFHWYVRLDDDVYLNIQVLRAFLSSINSSRGVYMGHPGTGKSDEKGNLGLQGDKPYCMGGPGVILSGPTLRAVAPHLHGCLNETVTSHEDSELGRCVEKITGLSCTQAKEFDELFSQNYNEKTGIWTLGLQPEKTNAISYHPMKQPKYLFEFHIMLLSKTVRQNMRRIDKLYKDNFQFATSGFITFDVPDVKTCLSTPCDLDTGQPWACINAYDVFSLESDSLRDTLLHRGRVFGLSDARHALGRFLKRERIRKRLRLSPVSYQRVRPQDGLEHILITKDKKSNYILFRALQKFDPVYFREIPARRNRHI